ILRRYYRRPGYEQIPLPGQPGSQELMAAYEATRDRRHREPIGINRNAPDSVARAVGLYLNSATFAALAPDTRRSRRNELERFRVVHGSKRLALMEKRHVERHPSRQKPRLDAQLFKGPLPLA